MKPEREPFNGGQGNTKQIRLFFHCAQCASGGRRSDIEAGWTEFGFQVWCRIHEANIVHVDFMGQTHPADVTSRASHPII